MDFALARKVLKIGDVNCISYFCVALIKNPISKF